MPVAVAGTLVDQQVDLIGKLNDVLREHPGGVAYRLVVTPTDVAVAEDTVLVQKIDASRGVIELHPRNLNDLVPDDVVHATQEIDPTDEAAAAYAAARLGGDCVTSTRPDGSRGHLYWTRGTDATDSTDRQQTGDCVATERRDGTTGHWYL